MIAVILPSRGLMFSQTAEELLDNLKGIDHRIYFSHKRPIPECFEIPTAQALENPDVTHLWFVEDDMVLPPSTLQEMLDVGAPVVTCDYPVTKDGKGAVYYNKERQPLYFGTGCTLIERGVFETLDAPYWRSDIRWTPFNYGEDVKFVGSMFNGSGYGLHDVTFGIRLYRLDIAVKVLKHIGQRKLIALGKHGSNDGAHQIEEWKKIVQKYQYKKIMAQPLALGARGELITIDTPTGGIRVSKKHAKKLLEQGIASLLNNKGVVIDDSEVVW